MLFSDSWKRTSRRPGAIRKEIYRGLHDVPCAERVGVYDFPPFVANLLKGKTDLFRLRCDEAPEEPATVSTENALKVECHISIQTNFMHSGIKEVGEMFRLAPPHSLSPSAGSGPEGHETVTDSEPRCRLLAPLPSEPTPYVPYDPHGSFRVASRY